MIKREDQNKLKKSIMAQITVEAENRKGRRWAEHLESSMKQSFHNVKNLEAVGYLFTHHHW
jgi:hypothetical protein